jgi:hypothetical protein
MKRWLAVAPMLAMLAGACGHVERPAPRIPVVPLTFETNLTASVECEYLGQIVGHRALEDAEQRAANLIIEYVIMTSTTTYNGVRTDGSGFRAGTALKCPPETVQRLVASAQRPPS